MSCQTLKLVRQLEVTHAYCFGCEKWVMCCYVIYWVSENDIDGATYVCTECTGVRYANKRKNPG
jgi:hypothetical protein